MDDIVKKLTIEMNDVVSKHEKIKSDIIELTKESDIIEFKINEKLKELHIIEKEYVRIVSELNNNNGL